MGKKCKLCKSLTTITSRHVHKVCRKCFDTGGNCKICNKVTRYTSKYCRSCRYKQYAIKNKKKIELKNRLWREKNKVRHRENSLRWQKEHPERTREIRRKTVSGIVNRYTRAKWRAKRRGFGWSISRCSFAKLILNPCFYCGKKLPKSGVALDRKNTNLSYFMSNVVPCCFDCNKVKSDVLTFEEMKAAMDAVMKLRN